MTHIPEGADPDVRADLGYPPQKDDWSFEISPGDSGWTYQFTMFEGGEPYLGTEVFDALPERFANIAGVSEVVQEDRELYLINSTLSPAELEAALWSTFQSSASEAFGELHTTDHLNEAHRHMDESQADAIARAILTPDIEAREALRRKREKEAWWLVEKRKVAWLALAGFPVGAVIAHFTGERLTAGGLWGAIAGGAIGWIWIGLRNRRRAR